jgi:hypothetical protein
MTVDARRAAAIMAVTLLVYAAWGHPLKPGQQQKPAPPPTQQQPTQPADQQAQPGQQPPPPPPPGGMTGTAKMKSSRQGKETATLGYNGFDPATGKVDDAKLKTPPNADDTAKAMQLSVYAVSDADVQAFAKEGNLNLTPPASPAQKKGK